MAVPYNHREVEKNGRLSGMMKSIQDFRRFLQAQILRTGRVPLSFRTGITCRSSETLYRTGYRST